MVSFRLITRAKETLLEVLKGHDAVFYADDVKMGMWLTRRGFRLGFYTEAIVDTETPETILGPLPNYYNQRVRSWDFAEHMLSLSHAKSMLFGYVKSTTANKLPIDISRTLYIKFFQFYSLYTNATDFLRIPGLVYYIGKAPIFFSSSFLGMIITNTIAILCWNYYSCRHRKDIQVTLLAILTFPLYKVFSSAIRVVAMVRCYLVYWPRFQPPPMCPASLDERLIKEIEFVS